jgi:hypothetical protein
MLEFKTANDTAAAAGSRSSIVYKAVPEHSTSAISSGLSRLFGNSTSGTHSRESSASNVSRQRQEWEVTTTEQRHRARGLESVHQELDEYLEEPLETFSRIERVGAIERTVVFDTLAYWQVRATSFCLSQTTLTSAQTVEKRFPNLFCLAMDVLPAQASSVPCERLFSSGEETYTARRNRIQPKLMEALQALKFSARNNSLNFTEHLSAGFYPPEGDDLEVCDASEVVDDIPDTCGPPGGVGMRIVELR